MALIPRSKRLFSIPLLQHPSRQQVTLKRSQGRVPYITLCICADYIQKHSNRINLTSAPPKQNAIAKAFTVSYLRLFGDFAIAAIHIISDIDPPRSPLTSFPLSLYPQPTTSSAATTTAFIHFNKHRPSTSSTLFSSSPPAMDLLEIVHDRGHLTGDSDEPKPFKCHDENCNKVFTTTSPRADIIC